MAISHVWGADLQIGPSGDLAQVSAPQLGQQRVLRRLLTSPLEYIWEPTYGGGLGGMVGQPADPQAIQGLILAQMQLESAVLQDPPPVVTVQGNAGGVVVATIQYVDASSGQTVTLTAPIG